MAFILDSVKILKYWKVNYIGRNSVKFIFEEFFVFVKK